MTTRATGQSTQETVGNDAISYCSIKIKGSAHKTHDNPVMQRRKRRKKKKKQKNQSCKIQNMIEETRPMKENLTLQDKLEEKTK